MEPKAQILIVEDSRFLRTAAAGSLRAQGFRVLEAITGADAIRMARQFRPDLILLDMVLPGGLQGHEVLYLLKHDERTDHIPVIVLSGAQPSPDLLRDGAEACLAKQSMGIVEMMALVELVISGRRGLAAVATAS